ncbi:hypothetical protein GGG16DRAFT_84772 [Schizophyllum commune]
MLGSLLPGALSTTPPRPTRPCWSSDLVDRARIYAGRVKKDHSNRAHRLRTMTIALQFSPDPLPIPSATAALRPAGVRATSLGLMQARYHREWCQPRYPEPKGAYFLFSSTPHSTVRNLIRHKVRDQNQRLRTDLR